MFARLTSRVLLASALVAGSALAGPAALNAAPQGPSVLHLSTVEQNGKEHKETVLNCHPAGGPHRNAAQACAELESANGDFRQIKAPNRMCTMEMRPVTATLHGTWKGRKVEFSQSYSNPCQLRTRTGVVFDF